MSQNYTWPSVSVTATNPSIGTTGSTAPGSATLVGGENPSHNLEPLMVDSSGNLLVSLASPTVLSENLTEVGGAPIALGQTTMSASLPVAIASDQTAIPISAASLPLPTGAATAANQATEISELTTIASNTGTTATNTGAISGQLPTTLGQKASAASLAVVVASDQSAIPVSGSVTVSGTVSATQGTTPWADNITEIGGAAISLGQKVSASSLPVVIASDDTVAISAASLPLPTGAATAANQATEITELTTIATNTGDISAQLPATLGQKTSAASLAVVLASDQSSIPTSISGKSSSNAPVQNIYSSTNITTSAYTQLIASTSSVTNYVDIFDSSGQAMILAVGPIGSEVIQGYVAPGGDQIPLHIPAGSRVAYKALSANATAGYLLMSLYS